MRPQRATTTCQKCCQESDDGEGFPAGLGRGLSGHHQLLEKQLGDPTGLNDLCGWDRKTWKDETSAPPGEALLGRANPKKPSGRQATAAVGQKTSFGADQLEGDLDGYI